MSDTIFKTDDFEPGAHWERTRDSLGIPAEDNGTHLTDEELRQHLLETYNDWCDGKYSHVGYLNDVEALHDDFDDLTIDCANAVTPPLTCPHCGEADADRLIWVSDDTVRCDTCGRRYDPAGATTTDKLLYIAYDDDLAEIIAYSTDRAALLEHVGHLPDVRILNAALA